MPSAEILQSDDIMSASSRETCKKSDEGIGNLISTSKEATTKLSSQIFYL